MSTLPNQPSYKTQLPKMSTPMTAQKGHKKSMPSGSGHKVSFQSENSQKFVTHNEMTHSVFLNPSHDIGTSFYIPTNERTILVPVVPVDINHKYSIYTHNVSSNPDKLGKFNLNDLIVVNELDNTTFGKQFLVQNRFTQEKSVMLKVIIAGNKNLELMVNYFEQVNKYKHEFIQKITGLNITVIDSSNFCLSILFEEFPTSLEAHVELMRDLKQSYPETDLLRLLKQQVEALSFMKTKNICHGYVNPKAILLYSETDKEKSNADFISKLSIPLLDDPLKWSFSLAHLVNECLKRHELYLSPLMYNSVNKEQFTKLPHVPAKSDIYSLGLCMIFAATMSTKPFFELRNKMDSESIRRVINKYLKLKYSCHFIEIITGMLIHDEKRRSTHQKIQIQINEIFAMNKKK